MFMTATRKPRRKLLDVEKEKVPVSGGVRRRCLCDLSPLSQCVTYGTSGECVCNWGCSVQSLPAAPFAASLEIW